MDNAGVHVELHRASAQQQLCVTASKHFEYGCFTAYGRLPVYSRFQTCSSKWTLGLEQWGLLGVYMHR